MAQQYPKDYFSNPLKTPVVLSGTFGELRNNHFHSGIDLKTEGVEGLPIYAPANGHVYRINIRQYGYGKALYIKHPNGYTTVYAHLSKFGKDIQEYVKSVQYKKQKYDFGNIYLKPDKFPIKKGEVIGYTGNTGSSSGPHLHYEIRDSKTQKIINPMHFGLTTPDNRNPILKRLMVYPLNGFARVNKSANKIMVPIKKAEEGMYTANKIYANGTIGFGISAFDRQDRANNKNGIYSLEMLVNGKKVYYHNLDMFSFSESKYINLLIDYQYYSKHRKRIQKTHRVKNNNLSIYKDLINNGKLNIEPNLNYRIEITAKDFEGNSSSLNFLVEGVESNTLFTEKDTTAYKIARNNFTKFEKENVTVAFPKKTVYKDTFINFNVKNDTAFVHKPNIPLHKSYTLTFLVSHLSPKQRDQVYIANVTREKYPYFVSARKRENKIFTTTRTLGTYTLKYDDKEPTIKLLNFKDGKWISALTELKVKIKDRESGIKSYSATINGEWILMEYEHKKGVLTYDFSDKKLNGAKHLFEIIVSDNVGNTKTLSATFFKK